MFEVLDSSGLVVNGQKTTYRVITRGPRGLRVRFVVSLDTSYASQSTALATLWASVTGTWNPIGFLTPAEWACDREMSASARIDGAVELLESQVMSTLT